MSAIYPLDKTSYVDPTTDRQYVTDAEKTIVTNLVEGDADLVVNSVAYDTTPATIPIAIGSRYWDVDSHTTALITTANTTIQDGQEVVQWCVNKDTVALPNGTVVKITIHPGAPLAIVRASAATENSSYLLGMATQSIAYPNGEGFVTMVGRVNGIDTSLYDEGTPVFLGIDGAWTTTKLAAPYHANFIGTIGRKHATEGYILINPTLGSEIDELHNVDTTKSKTTPIDADAVLLRDSEDQSIWKILSWSNLKATLTGWITTLFADVKDPTGFNNLSHLPADQAATVSVSGSTFTVAPVSPRTTFDIYYRGSKIVKTGAQTLSLLAFESVNPNKVYITYSSNGTLSSSTSVWSITAANSIPVAIGYWNGSIWRVGDETHGINMPADVHAYLHWENQSVYHQGFDLNTATMAIGEGDFHDEDKVLFHAGTATKYDLWYRNPLSVPTKMTFAVLADATKPFKLNGATPQYEDGTAFVDVPDNGYFNCWIIATHCPDPDLPDDLIIGSVCPQEYYLSLENARSEQWSSLDIEDRWVDEICKLYRVTFRLVGTAVNYIEHIDVRGQKTESQSTIQVDDVIINGLIGNIGGNSGSVETFLENLDAALTEASYYVSAATVTDGTGVGSITAMNTDDGTYYQVSEESGGTYTTGPIDVTLTIGNGTITPTTLPQKATVKVFYNGATVGHSVQLKVNKFGNLSGTGTGWQNMGAALSSTATFTTYIFNLADYCGGYAYLADLVSGGNIQIRAVHAGVNGVNTHYVRFDYVVAQKQTSISIDPTTILVDNMTSADGDTTHAPTRNVLFDELALKLNKSGDTLTNYKETLHTATTSGNVTINLANGNVQRFILDAARQFTMPADPVAFSQSFVLIIEPATFAVTWNTSPVIEWLTSDGTAPTLVTTANLVNVLTFIWDDVDSRWLGFLAGKETA